MRGLLFWAIPLVGLGVVPLVTSSYAVVFLLLLFVNLTLAESYGIVGGYLGYVNLGHASSFGLGAYAAGILVRGGLPFPVALGGAVVVPVLFWGAISYPFLRLRGAYFSVATFGLLTLLELLANNLSRLTGGSEGLSFPPGYRLVPAYYLTLGLAAASVGLSLSVARSRLGLALRSIREDEEAASAFGVRLFACKVRALLLSAAPAGAAGAVFAWYQAYITPGAVFGLEIALMPIAMAMLGGSGPVGPVVGALFLTVLEEVLWTRLAYFHLTVFGLFLALVGLAMPGGLTGLRWSRRILARLPGLGVAAGRGVVGG